MTYNTAKINIEIINTNNTINYLIKNQIAQNGNMEQNVANSQNTLYNISDESGSDINEQIQGRGMAEISR